jgi:hypothetical protein
MMLLVALQLSNGATHMHTPFYRYPKVRFRIVAAALGVGRSLLPLPLQTAQLQIEQDFWKDKSGSDQVTDSPCPRQMKHKMGVQQQICGGPRL